MSWKRLISHPVRRRDDVRVFFDRVAGKYRESHGDADRLLAYRLGLLRRLLPGRPHGLLVEIGCGPGLHLLALAERFNRAIGLDLSPLMIEQAERLRQAHPASERLSFRVDPAEELASVQAGSVDALICVGAFEHLFAQDQALFQIRRVLKRDGRFVCLTPNGRYVWYTRLARCLNCEIRHLSTDRFLDETEFRSLLRAAELDVAESGYWTFVPRGDMPPVAATLLRALDAVGRAFRIPALRGGLYIVAKPTDRRETPDPRTADAPREPDACRR